MPRKYLHLSPRYIINRLSVIFNEKRYPMNPWLTKDSVNFLNQIILPTDIGVEFGSGRSTIWFAKRLKHLISIEDNKDWHREVSNLIVSNNLLSKIDYRLSKNDNDYASQALLLEDNSIDFCLVDGSDRDVCALNILPKLKSGSILCIDNINWFLPHESHSPASRKISEGYKTEMWGEFSNNVKDWRRYWTSNGVTDTCIWIKP